MTTVAAGARITGSFGFEEFGAGLAGGDFNGDGVADLAINYRIIGSGRGDSASTVQIIFGGDGVLEGVLDAALLAGGQVTTSGVTDIGVGIDVPGPLSFSDVNDDGAADLLIGAPRAQSAASGTGGAGYILFGIEGDAPFTFGLANLTNGIDGQAFFSTGGRNAGSSIVNLGDVDGDGADELFVGVPFAPAPGGSPSSGLGYVFERGADAVTDLAGAFDDPPKPDATILFSAERAFIAEDAAPLGDVNGDGVADFLITGSGAIGAGTGLFSGNNGEAYLIYGQQGGLPGRIDVTTLDGAIGTQILATDIFQIADRAEAAGDVNGDGLGDFLLIDAGPSTDEPLVYLVYGVDGGLGASFDLSTSDGVSKLGGVPSAGNANGVDIAGIGDVNGDGFGDILVGRAGGGPNGAGEIALVFGSATGVGDTVDLDNLAEGAGYRFIAAENEFGAGFAVTGPGDLNGDDINDFVIGAPFYNPESNAEFEFDAPGAAFIIYGGADRLAALDALDGADGVIALANVTRDVEIPDGPAQVTYSLGQDISIAERNGEDTTFAVTVTRSDGAGAAEIALAISGTATIASGDIDRIGGTALFAEGETEATVLFRVTDDALDEPTEQAIFDLSIVSSETPGVIGDGRQIVTIEDDDAPAVFDLGQDFTIAERNGQDTTFAIVITRSSGAGVAEVALTPSGSATASGDEADFARIGGSGVFDDGETETSIIFRLTDDLRVEFAEEVIFDLSLVGAEAPSVIGDGQQVVTINDDDQISFFSLGQDFTVAERNGQDTAFAITVTRSFAEGAAEIALTPSGSATAFTEDADFLRIGGSNSFADGETETTILYRVVDDLKVEFAEEAIFDLSIISSDAAADVADGRQVVTITDDDEIAFFSLGQDFAIAERNGQDTVFAVTATRSFAEGEAQIALTTSGSAASSGVDADVARIGGSASFAVGETETQVLFRVVDDLRVEFAEELIIDLSITSSDASAEVADGRQIVTINDDDEIAFFSLGQDFSIAERNGQDTTFAITVTRSFAEGDAEIALATSGPGAADAFRFLGSDNFADGETETQVLFRLIDDSDIEPTEDLVFDLSIISSDASAEVADGRQVVSILDDDTPVVFSIDPDLSFTEGTGRDARVTTFVSRSSGVGEAVVNITLGGDATPVGPDRDYQLLTPSVTFADGETLKPVSLILVADDVDEPDETIRLGLNVVSSVGVAVIEDGTQIITIEDDDDPAPIFGGDQDDSLVGGLGDDRIAGRAGDDTIFGSGGDDSVSGGTGRDRLFGGFGDDTVNGGAGDDLILGGRGDDRLAGQSGDDTLRGGEGDDSLIAGRGDDLAVGGAGDDAIAGGAGADRIEGEAGADRLFGGDGVDSLFGGAGGDRLEGGADADILFGNSGADTLRGDAGSDQIFGGSGDDLIFGGSGADLLRGGGGDDSLSGGGGDDSLFGDAGDDVMLGRSGRDELTGGGGDDRLIGGLGGDRLFGGDDRDTVSGGAGDDFIRGGAGRDLIAGGGGRDLLSGEAGADVLNGGGGADIILGGSGSDVIVGDGGDDALAGGGGRDLFVFATGSGDDLIRDFRNNIDRIEIIDGADRFADLQIASNGGAAIIAFGAEEIRLDRFDAALLDASDFVFS